MKKPTTPSDNFLKDFNIKRGFCSKSFLNDKRTVCVQHKTGKITEHPGISDPWRYIAKVRKEPDVVNAWIKEEK
jgi:hypothetical protein